ncbi:MAG: hypothetical protein ACREPX_08975 [Rhodanobacteraceae bacterium]
MAKIPMFAPDVSEALKNAPIDPEAAATLLRIAARYLRESISRYREIPEVMPSGLARYLANAFERAARVPASARVSELAQSLHLDAGHRRKLASWLDAGARFDDLVRQGESKFLAATIVAVEFNCSQRTAQRYWKQYKDALTQHDAIE